MFDIGGKKVALVTDSSCDLSDELLRRYDIRMVCLRMQTSAGEFRDRLEISGERLYEMLRTEIPKTSLPLPEDITRLYRQLQEEGCDQVLHISISSGLSGTYNLCRMMADDFAATLPITLVDSKTLSCGLGLLVLEAAEQLSLGRPVEEVVARIERLRKSQLGTFVIRTLEYLRKGGRIGLVEGVVGSLLQIKPVIMVNDDGIYDTLVKGRGMKNAVSAMCDEFFRRYQGRRVRLAIVHGNVPEEAVQLEKKFREHLNVAASIISPVSPVLAIHTGLGLLGAIVQYAEE